MSDLTDEELPGYALIHCETEVAAFHKKHVVRLLEMASMDEKAAQIRSHFKEWYHLGPEVIGPIVEKIQAKEKAG